jgi:serine protease inhibitor
LFQAANTDGVSLNVVNHMYVKSGFLVESDFLNSALTAFNAMPVSVDFMNPNTRLTINKWVEEATRKKIRDLVQKGK